MISRYFDLGFAIFSAVTGTVALVVALRSRRR